MLCITFLELCHISDRRNKIRKWVAFGGSLDLALVGSAVHVTNSVGPAGLAGEDQAKWACSDWAVYPGTVCSRAWLYK